MRSGKGLKEMGRGGKEMERIRERDGERGKEMVRMRERWFRISHWSKWSHR